MTCFNIGVEITGSPAMRAVALSRADCSQAMQVRLRRLALDMSKHSTNPKNKGANLGNAIKPKSEVLRDAGMRRNHRTECSTPSSIMKVWRDRRELRNLMKGSGG